MTTGGSGRESRDESPVDLFDTWVAHHEQRAGERPPSPDPAHAGPPVPIAEEAAAADDDDGVTLSVDGETAADLGPDRADAHEAGRAVLDALDAPAAATAPPADPDDGASDPSAAPAGRRSRLTGGSRRRRPPAAEEGSREAPPERLAVTLTSRASADDVSPDRGPDVDLTPRRGTRTFATVLLVLVGLVTAYAAYRAYEERTSEAIGLAAILAIATLVVAAARASTSVAHLSVRGGQLEVRSPNGRFVFDLASTYTPVEVIGRPNSRTWKVLFLRRGMAPFVVDSSMVDPQEFMAVLEQYRPDWRRD